MRLSTWVKQRMYSRWICPRCGCVFDYLFADDLAWWQEYHEADAWCNTWINAHHTFDRPFTMTVEVIYKEDNGDSENPRLTRRGLRVYQLTDQVFPVHFGPDCEHLVANCSGDGTLCVLRQENPWGSTA